MEHLQTPEVQIQADQPVSSSFSGSWMSEPQTDDLSRSLDLTWEVDHVYIFF